jgi:hypothetical protein
VNAIETEAVTTIDHSHFRGSLFKTDHTGSHRKGEKVNGVVEEVPYD